MTQAAGGDTSPHIARAADALARLPDKERSDAVKNLSQILQLHDPRFQRTLGLGGKEYQTVPSGSTLYNVLSQKPEYQADVTLGTGQGRYPGPGGQAIALGPEKLPMPASQGYGNAINRLLDPVDSPLPPEHQNALADAIYNQLMRNVGAGGTNAPPVAAPRKVIRDPNSGQLILQ